MTRIYRELTEEEIVEAQAIDKEISEWAQKDYAADIAMATIYKEVSDRLKRIMKKPEDFEAANDLRKSLYGNPLMVMEEIKQFFKEQYGRNWEADEYTKMSARFVNIREAGRVAQENVYRLNQKYTGWRRFYLVPGGHIHDQYNCSTCHKMGRITEMMWLYDISGLSLETAVKQYGTIICTICYPEAPVAWSSMSHGEAEKIAERCEGSGKYLPDAEINYRKTSNYATCPDCDGRFIISKNTRELRAHKPYVDPYCEGSNKPPGEDVNGKIDPQFESSYGICSVCGRKKYMGYRDNLIERHNKPKVKAEK